MYYDEKIIDGVLMCRSTPNGKWRQASIEVMSERLVQAENIKGELRFAEHLLEDIKESGFLASESLKEDICDFLNRDIGV